LGISDAQIASLVAERDEFIWKRHKKSKWLVTVNQWKMLQESIQSFLKDFHTAHQMEGGVQKEEIRQGLKTKESVLDALLLEMEAEKMAIQKGKIWSHPDFEVTLNTEDDSLQSDVLQILDAEGFTPSNLVELSGKTGYPKDKLMQILKVAEQQGKLLRINGNLMFTQRNFLKLKEKVNQHFTLHGEMSVPEFKEMAQTSRKYAVPLLEYFDKVKITYRDGNARKLIK